MAIGRSERLTKSAHVRTLLPPSWGTLYDLTKLDDGTWALAMERGIIRPDMERKDLAPLLVKARRREARETELAQRIMALPAKKYGVIVADPEWRFEPWNRTTGMDRAADNHYPTSVTETIATRPVGDVAADDAVLFLWATVPMLPQALVVMKAWGFDYRTNFCWAKNRIGTGYWNRNKHELLLLGVRGNVPAPAPGKQWDSLLEASVGRHSEKPACFMEMIEVYFPTLPKIELNCRGEPRPGWDAWSNEACKGEGGR
jgi:N6-adenosine-specific RNA methylase IME4